MRASPRRACSERTRASMPFNTLSAASCLPACSSQRGDSVGRASVCGSGVVIVSYTGAARGTGGTVASGTGTAVGQTLHTFTNTGNSTLALNALTPVLSGTISGAGNLTVDATGG